MYLVLQLIISSQQCMCERERENVGETNKQACNFKTSGLIIFKVMLL